MEALRWRITGRVQGVWFRDFTRREARALGLRGWVRNLPDGTVEASVVGDREALARLRDRLAEGPPLARVEAVDEEILELEAAEHDAGAGFEIRY